MSRRSRRRRVLSPAVFNLEKLEGRLLLCSGEVHDTPTEAALHALKMLGTAGEYTDEADRLNAERRAAEQKGNLVDQDPSAFGQWSDVINMGAVAIHSHLLPDGNMLYWDFTVIRKYDPISGQISIVDAPGYQVFCSGHSFLPDGRLFVSGGQANANSDGLANAELYDPYTDEWIAAPNMNARRWYPTNTTLASGDVLTVAGQYNGTMNPDGTFPKIQNKLPQIYDPDTNTWRNLTDAQLQLPLYPYMYQAPDGRVFQAGPSTTTRYLDTSGTGAWQTLGDSVYGYRDYGSSVMYAPGKILILGGSHDYTDAVTNDAEVINLNDPTPKWRVVDSMEFARKQVNSTILPDGTVLVTGGTGATGFNNSLGAVFAAEIWDPVTEQFTTLASAQVVRQYHSTALLLPDGRVFVGAAGIRPTVPTAT